MKPAIIILHGWGLSGARFFPLADKLKGKGYQVFVPDLPGFGASVMPKRPYSLSDYADFLDTYIQEKRLKSTVLIGHSFGGRVTLAYCMRNKPNLQGIILTGTPGVTPVPRKKLFLFIMLAKIGKFFFSVWPLSIMQEKIRSWYYYAVGAREFYRAQGVMRETFKRIVAEDLTIAMKAVSVPTLLVWGEEDRITPIWIADKMQSIIQGSKLEIIQDHDHGVPYKDPNAFVAHIEEFIHTL